MNIIAPIVIEAHRHWGAERMARQAQVVIPGAPRHATQRGNRREPIFLEDGDQEVYREL